MNAASIATAEQFAIEVVAPLVERPEVVLPRADVVSLIEQAAGAGLTGAGVEPDALRALARVNGGVAFGVHRAALAARSCERLGLDGEAVSLTGHYGLGRDALPRLLAGRALPGQDVGLLTDYFDLTRARVVVGADWQSLIAAGFDGTSIVWRSLVRDECNVVVASDAHGFDELETTLVSSEKGSGVADTDAHVEAMYRDMLGMLAVATGLAEHALEIARAYAAQRRQGGQTIEGFPAVQQMLAQISATARAGIQQLAWFAAQPPDLEGLTELCAARSHFHPACCLATNNAIQVLGGRGYMQDFGPEKLARDANTLRVLAGTPVELQLFVAEMERAG